MCGPVQVLRPRVERAARGETGPLPRPRVFMWFRRMEMRKRIALLGVLLCLLASAAAALAQEQTGAIQGTVKDSSGAVLPGVTVEARSPSAVGVNTAVTNAQGVYRFPALPPGTYDVTATLAGFNTARVE